MPRILVVQPKSCLRQIWTTALALAGHEVIACDTTGAACMAMWARDIDALVVATPPEDELMRLCEATPGPWVPPIVLAGAPYGEATGVPRGFAAARCVASPSPDRLVATVRELLIGAGVALPIVPHGRTDVPLRLPAHRVAKWRSWLVASAVAPAPLPAPIA